MRVIPVKFTEFGIVIVHHRARLNIRIGKANGHVVFENGLAFENLARSNFVASLNLAATRDVLARDFGTDSDVNTGHNDIVVWVQADNRAGHCFVAGFKHDVSFLSDVFTIFYSI